ncbi:unnamed protein product [Effrenium voratum]|uniref:Uncharacterized protein n=1 Tax=Effrenium voratum TaxID=2562239 RepID=A0AA36MQB2_9DINO|nr:unnamed protein product [Effrenium voratum]
MVGTCFRKPALCYLPLWMGAGGSIAGSRLQQVSAGSALSAVRSRQAKVSGDKPSPLPHLLSNSSLTASKDHALCGRDRDGAGRNVQDMALKLGVLPQEHWPNSDVSPDNTAERPDCYDVADSKVDSSVPQDVHGARPLQDASVRASCGVVRPPTRAMPTKPQLRYRRRQICPRLKNRAIHEDLGEMVAPNEGLAEPAMWVDGDHIPVLGKWEKEMPELMDDTSPGSDGETRVIFKVPEDWRKAEKEAQELRELLEAELLEQQEVEEKLAREREADTLSTGIASQAQGSAP